LYDLITVICILSALIFYCLNINLQPKSCDTVHIMILRLTDVLGVVTMFGDVQHLQQRSTGRELVKRDVNIVDNNGATVNLLTCCILIFLLLWLKLQIFFQMCVILWGKQAEEFDGSNNPIPGKSSTLTINISLHGAERHFFSARFFRFGPKHVEWI